jgi:pyruvate, orthophosphate dikinase
MQRMGLPVPPGWILSTEACKDFLTNDRRRFDDNTIDDIKRAIHDLENMTGKFFFKESATADPLQTPLLLSVRSGAPVSMPGMMNTVLNVGMNDEITERLARLTNNRKWAYDTYRRFLQMFGDVVLGIDKELYEDILTNTKKRRNIAHESEFNENELKYVIEEFKKLIYIPDDPWTQLMMSIEAVFLSWNSPRAIKYRDLNNIPNDLGTGVIIQSMVFGNLNDCSGSGVAFSRNPATGEKGVYGEYLPNAEGEDVVAGIRTPLQLADLRKDQPSVYDALEQAMLDLEVHYRDMQVSAIILCATY